jgi:hypothetical protein
MSDSIRTTNRFFDMEAIRIWILFLFEVTEFAVAKCQKKLVIDRGDSRSQPCRSFRFLLLGPGPHLAFEDYLTSLHLDGDVFGVDFCTANQRILDLLLQVSGRGERLYDNQIAYTLDTLEPAYDALNFLLLVLPYHCALERYPAVFDRHLNLFGRDTGIPLKRVSRGRCDVGIRTLANYAHCNIVDYGNHSVHVMGIFLSSPLLQEATHCSRKREHTIFDRNADFSAWDATVPTQFGEYVCLNLSIRTSQSRGCHVNPPD